MLPLHDPHTPSADSRPNTPPIPRPPAALRLSVLAAAALLLGACATTQSGAPAAAATPASPVAPATAGAAPSAPAQAAAGPASAASGPTATAAARPTPPDPSALKPFAEISKGATRQDGLFPIWRKDEKVWLEIPRSALNKPFMFDVNIASSIGERGLYASQMGPSALVEWRRIGNQVQLIALNTAFRAEGGNQRAVEQAFSPSLLGSISAASADDPERKAFLVDASFLLSDIPGYSTRIEAAFRLPYGPDRANSYFEATRAEATLTTLSARMHFATPRIPAPPLTPTPFPVPPPPQAVPDPRSFFVTYVYNFQALPEAPMRARLIDPRVGHFPQSHTDLSSDLKANPRVHYVKRWRLEKKDPAAELSEAVTPITYWIDKNVPPRYRGAVEAGIVEWNKAFERIGFKNAVVAKQQPDDATWDNMDGNHASIRWFVGADVGFAIGPSRADPRTGEILDADIGMSDVFARGSRRQFVEDVGRTALAATLPHAHGAPGALPSFGGYGSDAHFCSYAHEAAQEMSFALDILEARGDIAPDSPEAEAFVQQVIKDTIMHEVGHTLGLKHNFKASTTITRAQLKDKAFTDANAISGSVMDYNAPNLALKGEPQAAYHMTTLGPYDYWAIEYAYKPIAPADEAAELGRIAARSTEPALAFADDTDAGGFGPYDGMDPLANRFDLGDDPLAYYKRRLQLSQELWTRVQERPPQAGEDPLRRPRSLMSGFRQLYNAAELVGKYVGGMHAVRDLPGTTGRASLKPVDPAKQREALQFLATGLFSIDSFRFKPEFLSSLTVDYSEWERPAVNVPAAVARVQLVALDRLLGAPTAQRLLDLPGYVPEGQRKGLISLAEVYGTVQSSIWSELKTGSNIDRLRRNLQREHLKRVQTLLTRAPATLPPDALSLARLHAAQLQADLRKAAAKPGLSIETQAHLNDSLGTLTEALRATMQRS
ncbi:zinc-dependent metalloprotease [Aquabacterium humicola]|uniref:zinc-dependent metalloprotease n=1 Tax=Aquabacterium humicola TaxID=3237377 RepID=UPI0025426EB5|nr:zinc-dependent metalloprotease [Rubrivivax pictus]